MKQNVDRIIGVVSLLMGIPVWLAYLNIAPEQITSENFYWLAPLFTLVLGLVAGLKLAGSFHPITRLRDKKNQADREETKQAEQIERTRTYIKHLDINMKTLLKHLSAGKYAYCQIEYGKPEQYLGKLCNTFIEWESVSQTTLRLSATNLLNEFFSDNDDILDVVTQDMIDEKAVYDPEKKLIYNHHSYSEALYWWWYSDKPIERKISRYVPGLM